MIPILQRIHPNEYNMLIANCDHRDIPRGEIIFHEGEPANYLYFIHKGEVRIYKDLGQNKEILLFTRNTNDCFGEIGVFGGEVYSNSAEAMKNSIIYYIKKDDVMDLIEQNGKLGMEFICWFAESLDSSKAKIRDYVAFGSEGAIASVFVRYTNMYGIVTKNGIRITEPVKLQDVSKHIGVSRETVSRVVNRWKEKGIVENNNKYYIVKDMNYFRKLLACDKCAVENCTL
ncbi:Crp/Fnr family transcriptional regulator [Ornithinibacillus gellani]|uniref:Crp/Fnr family transcriptional regulator n=1 Tax=Ornithinibacillus gellani TaxID=2293253 RepID=UPI001CC1F2BB|nr:Crp/Fnr family transcriptional regulator [Ornithinibacillus gellani]